MKAAFMDKIDSIKFIETDAPCIKNDNEVLIRVVVTGICGSEIHAYHGKHPYRVPPVISGHELSGVIEEVGKNVTKFKAGDRVTVEPHYGCGKCTDCLQGDYNICKDKKVLGTTYWPGSFGEYIIVPEQTIVKLPDNVSFEQGALIEPIAVGVHAVRTVDTSIGDTVAILGAGPIGLGIFLAAKGAGATKIFITDALDFNLDIAKKLGCKHVINPLKENCVDIILNETNGKGVDKVFLGVGVESVLNDALKICKRKGVVSEVALFGTQPKIESYYLQNREIRIQGSSMYTIKDFQISVDAISEGIFDTSLLISKVMPIEEVDKAFEIVDKRTENVIKILLKF